MSDASSSIGIFRHRDFRWFFTAAAISNGASWMQLVAVPALLYNLTRSGTWTGFSTFASMVPSLLLTPYAGVLCDRVSRRLILAITQSMQMSFAFLLWGLYLSGHATPWIIVAIGFGGGISTGFQAAAWQSFVPLLVPKDEMLHAVKLNSVQFTMARVIGPAFAGVAVKAWGTGSAIFLNAITYLLVLGVLAVVNPRDGSASHSQSKVLPELLEGMRYVWQRRPLRIAVMLAFVTGVGGQSLQFVAAAVAPRVFGRPSTDNSYLILSWGLGAMLASGVSVLVGDRFRRSRNVFVGLLCYTACLVLITSTRILAVGMLGYFVGGIGHLTVAVGLNTLMQGNVPERVRGRAMSFYLLGIIGGIPLGGLLLGVFGDIITFRGVLAIDAVMFAATTVAMVRFGWLSEFDADAFDD